MTIHPGSVVRLSAMFSVAGVPADPTVVRLLVRPQNGSPTVYQYAVDAGLVRDAQGEYHLDYAVPTISPSEKLWFAYRWESTGTPQTAAEATFTVSTLFSS